jgi:hypothetical protein
MGGVVNLFEKPPVAPHRKQANAHCDDGADEFVFDIGSLTAVAADGFEKPSRRETFRASGTPRPLQNRPPNARRKIAP